MHNLNRDADVNVRVRRADRDTFERAAALEGVRLSEWVRRVLIDAARRRLAKAER